MKKVIKNATELRNELLSTFSKVQNEEVGLAEAKELANLANRVTSTAKVQLEYNKFTNNLSPIEFLENGK